jgi:hypothetical protein
MTCRRPSAKDVNQRSPSRLVDAQNAQIWTASVVIGIEPKSTQIGGSARGYQELSHHWQSRLRPSRHAARPAYLCSAALDANFRFCMLCL